MLLHSGFPYRRQTDLLALSLTGIGSAWMLGLLLAEHCVSLSSLTGKFDRCLVRLKGCRGHVLLIGLLMILGQLEFTKEFGKFFFLMPLIVPLHGYSNSRLKSRVAQSYHTSIKAHAASSIYALECNWPILKRSAKNVTHIKQTKNQPTGNVSSFYLQYFNLL